MKQTEPFSLAQYVQAGCGQVRDIPNDLIALGIYAMTGGMMCNGCPHMERGCEAFKVLHRKPYERPARQTGETVRQEASRLGVSISEVRRRRNSLGPNVADKRPAEGRSA